MSFAITCIFIYMSGRVSEREENQAVRHPYPYISLSLHGTSTYNHFSTIIQVTFFTAKQTF